MNTTDWSNISNVGELLAIANTNTSGIFWNSALWFLFIIILISLSSYGFLTALLAAGFISLVISLFLLYMGLVGLGLTVGAFVGIILITFMIIVFSTEKQ